MLSSIQTSRSEKETRERLKKEGGGGTLVERDLKKRKRERIKKWIAGKRSGDTDLSVSISVI